MSNIQTLSYTHVLERGTMSVATLTRPPTSRLIASFPTAAVATALQDELIEAVKAEASITGAALPSTPAMIVSTPFQIDSLSAVSILCVVEPILGIELPQNVVRAGGYSSIDQALAQLLPKIEAHWKKLNGGK